LKKAEQNQKQRLKPLAFKVTSSDTVNYYGIYFNGKMYGLKYGFDDGISVVYSYSILEDAS